MSLYAGPLPKTLVDFWRLVWQERPPSIVMITNLEEGGKIKCQRYWPGTGRCSFGPFEVTLTDQQMFADYTTRTLEAQVSNSYSMLFPPLFHMQVPLIMFIVEGWFRTSSESDPVPFHCLAGSRSTGLCHSPTGLPQESDEGTQL